MDAYLGGERAGKRGRGSHNKIPFIAAVETTQDSRPMKVHLRHVTGFRKTEIARYAQASLLPVSEVVSDGVHCFAWVTAAHCRQCSPAELIARVSFKRGDSIALWQSGQTKTPRLEKGCSVVITLCHGDALPDRLWRKPLQQQLWH